MCDDILDVILNELMRKNPKSCVVYEIAVTTGMVKLSI